MNYKSYNDLSNDIRKNISKLQVYDFDLIVGLPRSGLTPANMIALYLNVHCTDFVSFINNIELKSGRTRGKKNSILKFPHDAEKILLVDDSIATGISLKKDLELIPDSYTGEIITCAIYSSQKFRDDIDLTLSFLSLPRVFEWNIFHHKILKNSCFDIDGVLCVDPTQAQNDDGVKYRTFLKDAPKLFIPTVKVHSLVTNRLEKYRSETETWLMKAGVQYDNLIMLNLKTKEERQKLLDNSEHKANYYSSSSFDLFVESCPRQAQKIANISCKPVYCVETNVIYKNTNISARLKPVKGSLRSILLKSYHRLPNSLKVFVLKIRRVINN